jgi:hypothetical protein
VRRIDLGKGRKHECFLVEASLILGETVRQCARQSAQLLLVHGAGGSLYGITKKLSPERISECVRDHIVG